LLTYLLRWWKAGRWYPGLSRTVCPLGPV